ncbi:Rad4/PNGase transglutaminase-like fold [Lasallia pustulata]|uniref:Rad4/PNGase transglutaminase-like fold n=1 Tax=Lasallia pustulata TaxID=136370 RepID=A0A1W5DCA0_9LECA|nr:Rad4/PNGase transglutaminase-like fold [Lasallia pustulata]
MPPFIPRKRRLSTLLPDVSTPRSAEKPTLFDTADRPRDAATIQANKAFLDSLDNTDSDTSLSDVSSSNFEDALPIQGSSKRQKTMHHEEDEDEIDWEDAIPPDKPAAVPTSVEPSGDLELTLDKSVRIGSLTNPHSTKKGPSKIERQIRMSTHQMHVQFLLFHNSMRNAWMCDKEVQSILVGQLPSAVKEAIEHWKVASGMAGKDIDTDPRTTSKGKGSRKRGNAAEDPRSHRDWGQPAQRQERGVPNMSRGDPVVRLLKVLTRYWRKRFAITAPGLRKQGYKPLAVLETEIAAFKNAHHDPDEHGEKIDNLEAFKGRASDCAGSRDVGAQLFTALVRGLGLEARLVANLQPVGYGWSKSEEGVHQRKKFSQAAQRASNGTTRSDGESHDTSSEEDLAIGRTPRNLENKAATTPKRTGPVKRTTKGGRNAPIDLECSSELSSAPNISEDSDDESVIDVTPSAPRKALNKYYDKDMPFPIYWVEVVSPITHEVIPVDPLILTPPVASKPELLTSFEPRGAKADKAKMVLAYVIAFSPDGSAKDVTTRYLKRHMWPGKTKTVRVPVEKIPVYNKKGKIKHYEDYDWFKTVMSGYTRTDEMRTVVDFLEDAKDLKPVKPEKKERRAGEETLQNYKQSAEFVLQRHLRREEAILPGAKPVKVFTTGKGDKAKEEPVFRRVDVVICRTGESWHKEGRKVRPGEYPMKMVPVRAVTLTRKREVEEAQRDGEKLLQGLYAWDQTEWIIPPPIKDGVIPKNAFGNMDCYVPTMVPKGAVHIPLKSTVRICKRLGIDYAEAVTGFEFGKQRAVPVITGVVVAVEHEHTVIDEWERDEEERRKKEEGKREKVALHLWRKFLMGLRIIERVREEYGGDADAHIREEMNPFTNNRNIKSSKPEESHTESANGTPARHGDQDTDGGFLHNIEESVGGGFLVPGHDEEETPHQHSGGFIVEDDTPRRRTITSPDSQRDLPDIEMGRDRSVMSDEQPPKRQPRRTTGGPRNASHNNFRDINQSDKSNGTNKTAKRTKSKPPPPDAVQDSIISDPPDDASSSGHLAPSSPPPKPRSKKAAPKPKPTRKSAGAVKSRYFAHGSEDAGRTGGGEAAGEDSGEYKPTSEAKAQSNFVANGRAANGPLRRSGRKTM